MSTKQPNPDKSDGIEQTLREIITGPDYGAGRRGTVMRMAMDRTGESLERVGAELARLEREGRVGVEGTCLRWEDEQ